MAKQLNIKIIVISSKPHHEWVPLSQTAVCPVAYLRDNALKCLKLMTSTVKNAFHQKRIIQTLWVFDDFWWTTNIIYIYTITYYYIYTIYIIILLSSIIYYCEVSFKRLEGSQYKKVTQLPQPGQLVALSSSTGGIQQIPAARRKLSSKSWNCAQRQFTPRIPMNDHDVCH